MHLQILFSCYKADYIVRADYHSDNVFAIKFYVKQHRKSDHKYSKITNKGDVGNILITCLKVVSLLLSDYPTASFGFIGARTLDKESDTVEGYRKTQRFNVYSYVVKEKIGSETFEHIEYEAISGYLLINKSGNPNLSEYEQSVIAMFSTTYISILDV